MVELLAQHDGNDALKKYLPQMLKEYSYWMEGVETLQPGQQNKRVVKLDDGTILNRYWDDRDTPRPESGSRISPPLKATPIALPQKSTATCVQRLRPAGILAPAGWTILISWALCAPPASFRSISMR